MTHVHVLCATIGPNNGLSPIWVGRPLCYTRKDFNYLCHVNVEEWFNLCMFHLKILACKRDERIITTFTDACVLHQSSKDADADILVHWLQWRYFNSWAPGRCSDNFKDVIFKFILQIDIMIMCIFCEIAVECMPQGFRLMTSIMISQHWFREWLGAVRQQAITWTNVGKYPCRHMSSQCHNG